MSEALREFVEENGAAVRSRLECKCCGFWTSKAYHPFGVSPEVNLECPKCGSSNTERSAD